MRLLKKTLKAVLMCFGAGALLMLILAFTDLPYNAYYGLAAVDEKLEGEPDLIVILGGEGMPSPGGLIRTYYGNIAAKQYPNAAIIIALPYQETDSLYQLDLMAHELIVEGVDRDRILYETQGYSTHSQAREIAKMYPNKDQLELLIVSSPEHMYRAIHTFRKLGFAAVGSLPTFELPPDESGLKSKKKNKDKRVQNLSLRYNLWSYLQYELKVLREYFAICYYWMKGWI